ncbi:GspH/FimT family protein [Cyanobium sp. BA20m-p-22]|uniref:GspH/FimT family protein n=1 Tax=Cyanobium sp. BA20m-p-22 TaxID=2823704 RepID=UPI0020CCC02B|nr:GspH/FimT family protein [Cyanobium sp. BA20m-p-22]MCP9911319.1 GspH/FimT family protein [Cyanobium sp. BA20m-p-22]
MARRDERATAGLSLAELLVAVAVLALLAGLAFGSGRRWLAQQQLETATRLVLAGLDQGRAQAGRLGRPCAIALSQQGWQAPNGGGLPSCLAQPLSLQEGVGAGALELSHNLPAALRFSSNGLLLDGGTVVLAVAGTPLQRCVVMALPLGVTRVGHWREGSCAPA